MAICANTAGIDMTQEQAYATWWWEEGSGILPLPTEDMEEFAHRITQISWSNAADKEREACAKIVEVEAMQYAEPVWAFEIVNDIRARGQA